MEHQQIVAKKDLSFFETQWKNLATYDTNRKGTPLTSLLCQC